MTDNGVTSEGNYVVPISQSQKDILISISPLYLEQATPPDFESKYYWLNDLTDGQQISLDYVADFLSYDEHFVVDVPGGSSNVSLGVSGFQDLNTTYADSEGYKFTSSIAIYSIDEIKAFYNNGSNFYETSFNASNNDGTTFYRKVGDAPSTQDLSPRNLDFRMQNATFNNYTFSASPEFQIVESGWSNQIDDQGILKSLSWRIYAHRDDIKFPVLTRFPDELASENRVLNTEDLDNTYNRFIYKIDNQTYQDFLDRIIQQPPLTKQLDETYTLTKF